MPHKSIYYILAIVVIALDQYTKAWAQTTLDYAIPVHVAPLLNWTLLYNTGAAFSFLNDAGGWQQWLFAGLAFAISIFIVVYVWRLPKEARLLLVSLALVLGGALGNLYDRLTLGYVIDFIDVYVNNCGVLVRFFPACHWPAFNIADAAITIGAVLILVDSVINPLPARQKD